VLGGDTPITLTWSKDGSQLEHTSNVVITHVNEFTSLLAIEKTSGEDSGNYSCTASNSAMSTTVSAQLTVSGRSFVVSVGLVNLWDENMPSALFF
jgi:hypothetical protein